MLAKLKLVDEKDMAALRSELVGSDNNEDIDVRGNNRTITNLI